MSSLIVNLILVTPQADGHTVLSRRCLPEGPPLVPAAHRVPEGVVRGNEGREGREVARGTKGSSLAQPEGQAEVAAGEVPEGTTGGPGNEVPEDPPLVLEELALALWRFVSTTASNLWYC